MDAIRRLKAGQREIETLFREWDRLVGPVEGIGALESLVQKLDRHIRLMDEVLLPTLEEPLGVYGAGLRESVLPTVREEHHLLRLLLDDLSRAEVPAERLAARVDLLGAIVRRHFNDEEYSLFPMVRLALGQEALDALGAAIASYESREAEQAPVLRLVWMPERAKVAYEPGP